MSEKLPIGTFIPDEEPATESNKLPIGTFIPDSESSNDVNTVYLEDRGESYNYPATDDEDDLNYRLQTQVYGEDKNKFFMGVNTGIDVLKTIGEREIDLGVAAVKGFSAFFPSTILSTAGGAFKASGELMEEGPQKEAKMAARAGLPSKAIFETVMAMAAKRTGMDETLAKAGDDLLKLSNEVINHKLFKVGDTQAERTAFDIGGASASLLTAVGLAALTKDPTAASVLFGQIAASDTYVRSREAGKSPQESYQSALLNFGSEMALEYIGLDMFTKTIRGARTVERVFVKASSEFVQESLQTLSTEMIAKTREFSDKELEDIVKETLYSGAIGFVTGGVGGAVQVAKENKSVMGEWRKAGFSDAEIEDIITPVMEKAYNKDFKASVFNALGREIEALQEQLGEESTKIVVDEDGNPVVLGMEMSEEEKFKYRDRQVIQYELADVYERSALGDLPRATETGEATVKETVDPTVQARINQIEAELKPLYEEVSPLMDKLEEGTLTPDEARRYSRLQKEITRREVERDEVGYEWTEDGALEVAKVEGRKTVRTTASEMYRTQMRAIKDQIQQFKEGMRAGRKTALADVKSFQKTLVDIITMSKVISDKQKTRLLKTITSVQTEKNLDKRIEQLDILIKQFENANGRAIYKRAIETLLRKSTKKKLDANTQKLFDTLLKMHNDPALDPDAYQVMYDGTMESVLKYDIALFNSIDPSLPELRQIYTDFKTVLEKGVDAFKLEKQARKQEMDDAREKINKEIASGKGKKRVVADPNRRETPSRRRIMFPGMLTFNTLLNRLGLGSGKGEGKSFIEQRLNATNPFILKTKLEFYFNKVWNDAYKEAFGLPSDRHILNRMMKDQTEEFYFTWQTETEDGKIIEHNAKLTRDEMRKRWMEWQRGVGRKTLERKNMYTESLIAEIEGHLTAGDFAFIKAQFRVYDQLYNLANPVFKKHKGVELPYDEFYSHLFTVGGVDTDVSSVDTLAAQGGANFFGNKITSQDVFKRATGSSAGLRAVGDMFALQKYINDMSHFVAYADLVTDLENLMLHRDTVANIKENFGDGTVKQLRYETERLKKQMTNLNPAWDGVKNFMNPLARSFLAKPTIGIKQLVSVAAYMDKVPIPQYVKYFMDFADPTKWNDISQVLRNFRGHVVMQARGDAFQREIKSVRDAIQNAGDMLGSDERLGINKYLLGCMRLGDRGAIYVGSYIMYKYETEVKGLSHQEAVDNAIKFTNETQQSPDPMQLSPALSDPNPITRLLTMFTQAPTQYFNEEYRAIANWRTNGIKDTARKVFVYHFLLPTIWQFVANGFRMDWNDEAVAAILGPLSYVYFLQDGAKNFVNFFVAKTFDTENPAWRDDSNAIESYIKTTDKLVKELYKIVEEGGLDLQDTLTLMQDLAKTSAPVGGAVSGAAEYGAGILKGAAYALDGEFYAAARKFMGYSNYTVEQAEED